MQRSLRIISLVAGLAAVLGAPTTAGADSHGQSVARGMPFPVGFDRSDPPNMDGVMALSLADAIVVGLEHNLDVAIARFDPRIADEEAAGAWGPYDPSLAGRINFDDGNEPTGSSLIGAVVRTETLDGNARLSQLVPWVGASVFADFNAKRERTDQTFATFSPAFNSTWTIGATIPLARGLIWNQPWAQVRTSRLLSDSAAEGFRASLMDTIAGIENAYWSLVASEEQRRVATKSLETARALSEQVGTQYEVGVVSKVEVVEADAGVAERELNMIQAENGYRNAQDRLIDQVLGVNLKAASTLEIQPIDRPDQVIDYDVDLDQAVKRAFELRPELASAEHAVAASAVQLQFAKNQRLPQVDLVGAYRFGGLRGQGRTTPNFRFDSSQPVGPTNQPTNSALDTGDGIGDTFSSYWDGDGREGYSVGGVVTIPLGNTAGRHGVGRSKFELRRSEMQVARLRQIIILEVRDGARNLQSAREGIGAAERRRLAAEEQLRAERIRLEHGESTPFDVLQRERDLVDAESAKIASYRIYRQSVTALERAQGTLLRSRGIALEAAAALR